MARFFGGESDGAEFSVARNQPVIEVKTTDRRSLEYIYAMDDRMTEGPIKTEQYRLERIAGDKQVFEVYVHSDMSVDLMLHRMIQHYRTIPSERRVMERQAFEAMIDARSLPATRHKNSDGSDGEYKHCAVQLAWESWLASASYSSR